MKTFLTTVSLFWCLVATGKISDQDPRQVAHNDSACLAWLQKVGDGKLQILSQYNTLASYHKGAAADHLRLICAHVYDPKIIGQNENQKNFINLVESAFRKNPETSVKEVSNLIEIYRDQNYSQADEKLAKILGSNQTESTKKTLIELSKRNRSFERVKAAELRPSATPIHRSGER